MAVQNQTVAYDVSTATSTTVVPAVAGKKIAVYQYTLVNGVATGQSVLFKSGSTNLSGVMQLPLAVGGGLVSPSGSDTVSVFTTAESAAFVVTQSAATQVGGHFSYKYV